MVLARRIYFLRNNLLKIPFNLLLAYHCPYGNSIKLWASHVMIRHILGVRNEINVLDLSQTLIQIRKALNLVFNATLCRRTLLIYSQAQNGIKFDNNAVFTFVNAWLPGLITNYRQLIISLHRNAKSLYRFGAFYLTNPQLQALQVFSHRPKLLPSLIRRKIFKVRYGNIPNLSLSLLDSPVWLNECHSLQIPSIQLCDTQASYDCITYPIISNQRSIPFTRLIISIFTETCAHALITEQFYTTKNNLDGIKLRHMFPPRYIYDSSTLNRSIFKSLLKYPKVKRVLNRYASFTKFSRLNNKSYRAPFFLWGFSKTRKFRDDIKHVIKTNAFQHTKETFNRFYANNYKSLNIVKAIKTKKVKKKVFVKLNRLSAKNIKSIQYKFLRTNKLTFKLHYRMFREHQRRKKLMLRIKGVKKNKRILRLASKILYMRLIKKIKKAKRKILRNKQAKIKNDLRNKQAKIKNDLFKLYKLSSIMTNAKKKVNSSIMRDVTNKTSFSNSVKLKKAKVKNITKEKKYNIINKAYNVNKLRKFKKLIKNGNLKKINKLLKKAYFLSKSCMSKIQRRPKIKGLTMNKFKELIKESKLVIKNKNSSKVLLIDKFKELIRKNKKYDKVKKYKSLKAKKVKKRKLLKAKISKKLVKKGFWKKTYKKQTKPLDPKSTKLLARRFIKILYQKKRKDLPFPYLKGPFAKISSSVRSSVRSSIPPMLRSTGSSIIRKNFFSNLRLKRKTIRLSWTDKLFEAQIARLLPSRNRRFVESIKHKVMNRNTFLLNKRFFNYSVRDIYTSK